LCAPPEAPPRVAVIRLPDAIAGTKQARKEMEDLAATIGKRQEELKKELAEVDEMKARLADTGNLLNGNAKEDLTREVGLKSGRLQRELEDLQWDSEQREARIYRDIGARMLSVIADFAKKNNFVLVLNASEPSASITFASPVVNITGRIVQQYDLAYPVEPKPAGAAQTPSSKATANPN
jgi:Skp family chaperone for outer membrane proteins